LTGYWPRPLCAGRGPFGRGADGFGGPFGRRTGFLRGLNGSAALGLRMNWGGPPFGVGVCPFDWPEGEALMIANSKRSQVCCISHARGVADEHKARVTITTTFLIHLNRLHQGELLSSAEGSDGKASTCTACVSVARNEEFNVWRVVVQRGFQRCGFGERGGVVFCLVAKSKSSLFP
jgi:hypothetical protein